MSEEIIYLDGITVNFDHETILDGISLKIKDGEFMTLLGPSGCGKTTTLRVLGGFVEPESGKVFFDGKQINGIPPHKRQVSTIFRGMPCLNI